MTDQHAPSPSSSYQQMPAGRFAARDTIIGSGTANADRRLGVIAAVCNALSLVGVLVHALGVASAPLTVTLLRFRWVWG